MASLNYSIASTDAAGKGKNVIGITSVTASETGSYGSSRTLSVTVKGRRIDSNYGLNSPYCRGSSYLDNFSSGISNTLDGTERIFCTFEVTVSTNTSGTATLGTSYYIDVGGSSASAGARSIRVTFTSASGLTPYNPLYWVDYYKPDGSYYDYYQYTAGSSFTVLSSGPSKSSTSLADSNFIITGNGNGGYFGNKNTTTTSITAIKSGKTNYTFSSWNTSANGNGTTYNPGGSYIMPSYDIALYPIYTSKNSYTYTNNYISNLTKPIKDPTYPASLQYTVQFNANGGVVSTSSEVVKTTRKWTFGGWATSASASSANAAAYYESATTVYAYWTHNDVKGKITLPTPTRIGYKFLGWGTSETQTSGLLAAGTEQEISSNITYIAIWKADGSVRLFINNTDKYKIAMVWMYYPSSSTDTKPWKLVIPYMKTSSDWKITAG